VISIQQTLPESPIVADYGNRHHLMRRDHGAQFIVISKILRRRPDVAGSASDLCGLVVGSFHYDVYNRHFSVTPYIRLRTAIYRHLSGNMEHLFAFSNGGISQ
jgi:hypothetical protein